MNAFVLPLVSREAMLARVGGKGANLAELASADFNVPPAFFVTTDAYAHFVTINPITAQIQVLLQSLNPEDPLALEMVSTQIRACFAAGDVPAEIEQAVSTAYTGLSGDGSCPVAVRSSATAEDLPGLSFAGQQATYLNIVDAIKRCWGSLWTARAIGYRARNHIPPDNMSLARFIKRFKHAELDPGDDDPKANRPEEIEQGRRTLIEVKENCVFKQVRYERLRIEPGHIGTAST